MTTFAKPRLVRPAFPALPGGVRLAVVGLGYVGLPLAVEFGKTMDVVGFDINGARVKELSAGTDFTLEVSDEELAVGDRACASPRTPPTSRRCNVFIVTTPTPIDAAKQPDLTPGALRDRDDRQGARCPATSSSTSPRSTRARPRSSAFRSSRSCPGSSFNVDFFVGYSPERINPGDKEHRLPTIVKVTSGSTPEAADFVDALYSIDHHRGHAPRLVDPRRRGRQGHREHPARRQHRPHQRARHPLQPARHRHRGGAAGGRLQVELPRLPPRPRRRPLHRRRPLLPHPQGAGGRLPPRDHPRRAAGSTTRWAPTSPRSSSSG